MRELENKIIGTILESVKYVPSEYENRLSASEVTADYLELYLKRKHKVEDNKLSQATIGSLLHVGMEKAFENEDVKLEEPMARGIPGSNSFATATVDYLDTKNKIVIDWKTTKEYTSKKVKEAIKKDDLFSNGYIVQLNHQNYILGGGYKMYLGMFLKDAKVNMKTGIESPSFELIEAPEIERSAYEAFISTKAHNLENLLINENVPPKCSDTWQRKIGGVTVHSKCRFYCSVNSVCPYFDQPELENKVEW